METIRRNVAEAISFYDRNVWLTGFCVICLFFTTAMVLLYGIGGIYYDISLISFIIGVILLFRLGCTKRYLGDVEDMIACIFHLLYMDLHYYLAANEYYEISDIRKLANFFYRLLLAGLFIGSFIVFMSLSQKSYTGNFVLHPVLATVWVIFSVTANMALSALLERKYNKFYNVEQSSDGE